MANDNIIEVEARLKDFMSSQLKTIEGNIKNFSDQSATATRKQVADQSLLGNSLKQLGGSWNLMGAAATAAVGAIGGMAIINKITGFLKDSVKEAREAIVVDAQLAAQTGKLSTEYSKFAEQQQRVTIFDDEEIKTAIIRFNEVTKNEQATKNLTKAAMDLSSATGVDLTTAALMLSRAINEGSTSIRGTTLQIKEATTKEEAYKNVMEAVNSAYGNRARIVAETDVGKIANAANQMKDIQETIGREIIPLQLQWNQSILDIVKNLKGPMIEALKFVSWTVRALTKDKQEMLVMDQIAIAQQMGVQGGGILYLEQEIKYLEDKRKLKETEIEQAKRLQAVSVKNPDLEIENRLVNQVNDDMRKIDALIEKVKDAKRLMAETPSSTDVETPSSTDVLSGVKISGLTQKGISGGAKEDEETKILDRKIKVIDEYEKKIKDAHDREVKELNDQISEIDKIEKQQAINREQVAMQILASQGNAIEQEINMVREKYRKLSEMDGVDREQRKALKKLEEKEIAEIKFNAARNAVAMTVDNLKTLADKHKEWVTAYKTMAIAQIIMDTYVSARAIFRGFNQSLPQPAGMIAGGIGAGIAIAAGFENARQVAAQKFAKGTNYAQGGLSLVGEEGPELLSLPSGSRVYNNTETKNMYGGTTFNLVLPAGTVIDHEAAARIERALPRMLERLADNLRLETFKSKIGV